MKKSHKIKYKFYSSISSTIFFNPPSNFNVHFFCLCISTSLCNVLRNQTPLKFSDTLFFFANMNLFNPEALFSVDFVTKTQSEQVWEIVEWVLCIPNKRWDKSITETSVWIWLMIFILFMYGVCSVSVRWRNLDFFSNSFCQKKSIT